MAESEILTRYFDSKSKSGLKPLLAHLKTLGERTLQQKTDKAVSANILAAIENVESEDTRVGLLLFSLAQPQKPLLGTILRRFKLSSEQKAQMIAQFVVDAADEHYPVLDLSRQELRSVPREIRLVHVPPINIGDEETPLHYREINLGYNPISRLRDDDFDALNHFEAVHLIGLKIGALPPAVERMTNLIMLNVSWTDITELPEEIYTLTRLKALKLNWTSVSSFSNRIAKLEDLAFIEVCETPFLQIIYSIQDVDDKVTTEDQRQVQDTCNTLETLRCRIDE